MAGKTSPEPPARPGRRGQKPLKQPPTLSGLAARMPRFAGGTDEFVSPAKAGPTVSAGPVKGFGPFPVGNITAQPLGPGGGGMPVGNINARPLGPGGPMRTMPITARATPGMAANVNSRSSRTPAYGNGTKKPLTLSGLMADEKKEKR